VSQNPLDGTWWVFILNLNITNCLITQSSYRLYAFMCLFEKTPIHWYKTKQNKTTNHYVSIFKVFLNTIEMSQNVFVNRISSPLMLVPIMVHSNIIEVKSLCWYICKLTNHHRSSIRAAISIRKRGWEEHTFVRSLFLNKLWKKTV